MSKSFIKFHESIQPWILDGKYNQALQLLQNSVYFKGRKIPEDMNLSRGQLETIFGNELDALFKMGIVKIKPQGNNPFGRDTDSYELVNPII